MTTHFSNPRPSNLRPPNLRSGAPREDREGAAMLIVLMVLMMTTATATFAIHSTTMEMRSAGYGRQAMQTEYLAEGASYAAMSYIDQIGPQAAFIQYQRTQVPSSTPYAPGARDIGRQTNLLRIRAADFDGLTGNNAPPVELTAGHASLGQSAYQPDFLVDGTDLHAYRPQAAGREHSGNDPMGYVRINLTARATQSVASDTVLEGDPGHGGDDGRGMHQTVVHSRAMVVVGPFGGVF